MEIDPIEDIPNMDIKMEEDVPHGEGVTEEEGSTP